MRPPFAIKPSPISHGSGDVGLSPHFLREAKGGVRKRPPRLGSAHQGPRSHSHAPGFLPLALTWLLRTACPAPWQILPLSKPTLTVPHARQYPSLSVSPREVQRVGSQASEPQLNFGFHNWLVAWSQANSLPSLSFSFLISNVELIIVLIYSVVVKMK